VTPLRFDKIVSDNIEIGTVER